MIYVRAWYVPCEILVNKNFPLDVSISNTRKTEDLALTAALPSGIRTNRIQLVYEYLTYGTVMLTAFGIGKIVTF